MATGTVRKRGNHWQIDISLGYIDGKQKRKRWTSSGSTKADTINEMNEELYKLNRQVRNGGAIDNNYRIDILRDQWLESLNHSTTLSDKSKSGYKPLINRAVNTLSSLNIKTVTHLDNDTIDKMLTSIIAEVSHSTANTCLSKLKVMLDYGVDKGLILNNPIKNKKRLPSKRVKTRRALTHKEVTALLMVSSGTQHYLLWNLLLNTGMRLAEALHARWNWIDWSSKTIAIEEDTADNWTPKTQTGYRTIPLSSDLFESLKSHKNDSGYIFFATATQTRDNLRSARLKQLKKHMRQVFAQAKGIKLSRSTSKEDRNWLKNELKLVDIHALRYTFITELISQNVDPKTVQYLAGHSDIKTTLNIYAQCRKGNTVDAIKKLSWS